jgi:adenylate kinase
LKTSKIFILLGPPGSGKGTLSASCIEEFGWLQLSTGNLCRENIAQGTLLGQAIQRYTQQGLLVPDEIIADLVVDWIVNQKELPRGVLFDGYPRTKAQAAALCDLLPTKLKKFDILLVKVVIDPKLLTARILNRAICTYKDCGHIYAIGHQEVMVCKRCNSTLVRRADDTEQSLQQRLHIYYQHEQEIIDFFVGQGYSMITIDGSQSKQQVLHDFKTLALC